jgi:hypothetical protein
LHVGNLPMGVAGVDGMLRELFNRVLGRAHPCLHC